MHTRGPSPSAARSHNGPRRKQNRGRVERRRTSEPSRIMQPGRPTHCQVPADRARPSSNCGGGTSVCRRQMRFRATRCPRVATPLCPNALEGRARSVGRRRNPEGRQQRDRARQRFGLAKRSRHPPKYDCQRALSTRKPFEIPRATKPCVWHAPRSEQPHASCEFERRKRGRELDTRVELMDARSGHLLFAKSACCDPRLSIVWVRFVSTRGYTSAHRKRPIAVHDRLKMSS